MKILAIEASGPVAGCALMEDDILRAEYSIQDKMKHSRTLVPMMEEIRGRLELDLAEIDAVAVTKGPGSFTGLRIGAASYCIYQSEDGKCFILDYWVFPPFRGEGAGHHCFTALKEYTKAQGAAYYELNSEGKDAVRFWRAHGFLENGQDEWGMPLWILRPLAD